MPTPLSWPNSLFHLVVFNVCMVRLMPQSALKRSAMISAETKLEQLESRPASAKRRVARARSC